MKGSRSVGEVCELRIKRRSVAILLALHNRASILDKIVDKNGPRALLVIIAQIVVDRRRKVQ